MRGRLERTAILINNALVGQADFVSKMSANAFTFGKARNASTIGNV